MAKMPPEQIDAFLRSGQRVAKIGVTRKDGRPWVVPIWYDVDDDGTIVFMMWHESVKAKTIPRDPASSSGTPCPAS